MSPTAGPFTPGNSSSGPPDADAVKTAALIKKARSGDRTAYGQIVQLYQDRLFNGLLRMVGDPEEARELMQETFARGLEKIDTFRGDASPYTWLFRIGINLAISQLRRDERRRTFSLDGFSASNNGSMHEGDQAAGLAGQIASRGDQPSHAMERREKHQIVLDALGRIDPEYRALLIMRDVEGFAYQQMSDALNVPLGTLKSRLFRARIALRDELAPHLTELRQA